MQRFDKVENHIRAQMTQFSPHQLQVQRTRHCAMFMAQAFQRFHDHINLNQDVPVFDGVIL